MLRRIKYFQQNNLKHKINKVYFCSKNFIVDESMIQKRIDFICTEGLKINVPAIAQAPKNFAFYLYSLPNDQKNESKLFQEWLKYIAEEDRPIPDIFPVPKSAFVIYMKCLHPGKRY